MRRFMVLTALASVGGIGGALGILSTDTIGVLPKCPAEDMVIVMADYPHPGDGYRCVHIDAI